MQDNRLLHQAKRQKKDEFYTQLSDIENELRHYRDHFRDKVVYCNCDDPRVSNFFRYFTLNFNMLGLRKLITTCYRSQQPDLFSQHDKDSAICLQYEGTEEQGGVPSLDDTHIYPLENDGDFRSQECIDLLTQADIVVTNPPFSLFRDYIGQLMEYQKKFLIIGHQNAVSYKEIFPLIRDGKLWLGYGFKGGAAHFIAPNYEDYAKAGDHREGMVRVSGVVWFTNLDHQKRHEELILYQKYAPEDYPRYDHYDAINVDRTQDIPIDYYQAMGVPITFLNKFNPDQFDILNSNDIRIMESTPFKEHGLIKDKDSAINGKPKYVRMVIKRKVP